MVNEPTTLGTRLLVLLALIAVGLFVFLQIATEVREGETLTMDRAILLWLRVPGQPGTPIGPQWLLKAMTEITALGGGTVLTLLTVFVGAYLLAAGRPALILSPFNYAKGYAWGVELSANYTHGPIDLYANLARGQEKGKDIVSAQYFFAQDELDYIRNHYIFTDHSQKWTASGGGSYTIRDGLGTLVPTADFVYGSGLRTDDPNGIVPNGGALPGYFMFNAGISQNFTGPGALKGLSIRADVLNLFDKKYQLRSGEGVGVGAPQWGERRGFFVGVTKTF